MQWSSSIGYIFLGLMSWHPPSFALTSLAVPSQFSFAASSLFLWPLDVEGLWISVFGPFSFLFFLNHSFLDDPVQSYNLKYHPYVDDSQIWIFSPDFSLNSKLIYLLRCLVWYLIHISNIQLTFEQHGFKLCGSTYMQIFFSH